MVAVVCETRAPIEIYEYPTARIPEMIPVAVTVLCVGCGELIEADYVVRTNEATVNDYGTCSCVSPDMEWDAHLDDRIRDAAYGRVFDAAELAIAGGAL